MDVLFSPNHRTFASSHPTEVNECTKRVRMRKEHQRQRVLSNVESSSRLNNSNVHIVESVSSRFAIRQSTPRSPDDKQRAQSSGRESERNKRRFGNLIESSEERARKIMAPQNFRKNHSNEHLFSHVSRCL